MAKTLGELTPDSDVVNKEPKVLLIGYGWVGQYVGKYFKNADFVGSDGIIRDQIDHVEMDCSGKYDLAVISVPTPMNPENGQCDTSIVEDMVARYRDNVDIFLVKSTVEIGTCDRLSEKYNTTVCMSPEYVGETVGHPLLEPRRDAFQIIGGPEFATEIIAEYFSRVLHADAVIMTCTAVEAEIIKYCENYWIMRRVDFWNDVFEVGKTFNARFQSLRNGLTLDPRLNRTHSSVYPNNRGWAGKCLSKDMPALAYIMREKGNPLLTLEHLIKKNACKWRSDYSDFNRLMPENPNWNKPRKISLTQGYEAIVSATDFNWLNQWKWYYAHGYAVRNIYDGNKHYQIRMHRLIMNTPEGMDTDHINGDKLDNRRENLRICTRSQNVANTFVKKQNNSGYKGVSWKSKNNKWVVQIRVNNEVKHIGLFDEINDAAIAYNQAALFYFGEFAKLNIIKYE